jgi:hypothetical protein
MRKKFMVKAAEGEGVRIAEEHKAKLKDKLGTAKGYVKGFLGLKSSYEPGTKGAEIKKKYLKFKLDNPSSSIRESEFLIKEMDKEKGINEKSKGGAMKKAKYGKMMKASKGSMVSSEGPTNKVRGTGIAVRGTKFKGVF